MVETPMQIAYPSESNPHLRIALGACRFVARAERGGNGSQEPGDPTDEDPSGSSKKAYVTITEAEPSFERIQAVFGGVPI